MKFICFFLKFLKFNIDTFFFAMYSIYYGIVDM